MLVIQNNWEPSTLGFDEGERTFTKASEHDREEARSQIPITHESRYHHSPLTTPRVELLQDSRGHGHSRGMRSLQLSKTGHNGYPISTRVIVLAIRTKTHDMIEHNKHEKRGKSIGFGRLAYLRIIIRLLITALHHVELRTFYAEWKRTRA
jgi:hypothetical protein